MFINAGPLYGRAKAAYERTRIAAESDRQSGQMDALEALVFSVIALEGFINESVELATQPLPPGTQPNPQSVADFATLLTEVERGRGSVQLKFMLARQAFANQTYDPSIMPYQDFGLLIDVRNALVHYRSRESFVQDETGIMTFNPAAILERLRSRNILSVDEPDSIAPWILRVATVAAARWACGVASGMVYSVLDVVPESCFKETVELLYRKPFEAPT